MRYTIVARWALAIAVAAAPFATLAGMEDDVRAVQAEWERIKYRHPPAEQEKRLAALVTQAEGVRDRHPGSAEALVWHGIVSASYAGARGGLGALGLVKVAKQSLERAIEIDGRTLNGSAYTSLGSLYYQVPGWPLGFGDDGKAREMLQKALAIDPDGIDPNYFLGDLLHRKGDDEGARRALEKALRAPPRPGRPLADEGRRREVRALLDAMR